MLCPFPVIEHHSSSFFLSSKYVFPANLLPVTFFPITPFLVTFPRFVFPATVQLLIYKPRFCRQSFFYHSDVVGASPVDAAPTTSSYSTKHLVSMDWATTTARRDDEHLSSTLPQINPDTAYVVCISVSLGFPYMVSVFPCFPYMVSICPYFLIW